MLNTNKKKLKVSLDKQIQKIFEISIGRIAWFENLSQQLAAVG